MRGLDENKTQSDLKKLGLKYKRVPVDDVSEDEYLQSLFKAAKALHLMIEGANQRVFVHCTSGYTRASTLVTAYLCLFMKSPQWKTPLTEAETIR